MKKIIIAVTVLVLLAGGVGILYAFFAGDTKFSPQTTEIIAQKRQRIREEIATLPDHPWAGEYYNVGHNVASSFSVSPEGGFVFSMGDLAGDWDRNYGDVAWDGQRLTLTFQLPNRRSSAGGIHCEFYPVTLAGRKYLVATDDVINFCCDVNSNLDVSLYRNLYVTVNTYFAQDLPDGAPQDVFHFPECFRLFLRSELKGESP